MRLKITKMHGNGNDFIIVDEFKGEQIPEDIRREFVKTVCDRRLGVGADGVIFVQKSDIADAKFRYFNSDGSEAEMCGNGIRCFCRYVVEEGYAECGDVRVETLKGVVKTYVWFDGKWWIKVDMGRARFGRDVPAKEEIWGKTFRVKDREFRVYAVNTGVPHAVIFSDLDFDIKEYARIIRYHDVFPEGVNVNFAKVISSERIRIRTYERGVEDETLSCGTGCAAVSVVANKLGLVGKNVEVITRGGVLKVEISNDSVYLIGSASRILDGFVNLDELGFKDIG